MFKNAKFFRFMPDQPGKGGVKTGYTSHRQINDTYDVFNFHVFVDRWRRDSASKTLTGVTNYTYAGRPLALHAYSSYSLTDPTAAAKTKILSHGIDGGSTYVLRDHSANVGIAYPSAHSGNAVAGTFLNIKNRAFVCSGDGEGTIVTMRDSNGVDLAANVAGFNYDLGVRTPSTTMAYDIATTSINTQCVIWNGSNVIASASVSSPIGLFQPGVFITVNNSFNAITRPAPWTATVTVGGVAGTSSTGAFTDYPASIVTAVAGNPFVTINTSWTGGQGPAIEFNGETHIIDSFDAISVPGQTTVYFDVADTVVGNFVGVYVTLGSVAYLDKDAGYDPLAALPTLHTITTTLDFLGGGIQTWAENGPQYAYAWYDPVTGHISNVAPLTVVAEKDQTQVQPRIHVGTTQIQYPTGNDALRFKYIIFFRTILTGGSSLYVMGSLDPASPDWFGISLTALAARGLITCTTKATAATGHVTCIPKADIVDGELLILCDGVNVSTTFEFDTNGVVTPGNVQVDISTDTTAIDVAARLVTAINGVGAGLAITATDNLDGTLGLVNDALGAMGNVTIFDTVSNSGFLTSGMGGGLSGILNGETVTIADGTNPATVFTFNTGGGVPPDVDISTSTTAAQIAAKLAAAINAIGIGLLVTATDNGNGTVTLVNDVSGTVGNVLITDTVVSTDFFHTGMINGAAAPAATIYKVDNVPDSKLLVNGALRAPLFTNDKPIVSYWNGVTNITEVARPAHMEYWDQRLWLTPTQDQASILFSCDPVQCTFGVAEESFPATNTMRIPAADGAVTGMRLIGSLLVIFTKRFAYYIAGSNETNYRLMRFATHMPGVGRYQTCEVPGESDGQASLAFFGTDGKVGLYGVGGKIQYLSDPIQKTIDEQLVFNPDYSQWRLHYASIRRRRYLILADPGVTAPVSNRGMMFTFDLDRGIWTRQRTSDGVDSQNSAYAFASIFGGYSGATTGEPQEEILYTSNTIPTIRAWLYDTTTSLNNGLIKTFALDGGDPKKLKVLNFVRLYVSQATGSPASPWTVYVYPNEKQQVDIPCIENPDNVYNLYKPDGYIVPLDGTNAKELIALPTDKTRHTTAYGVTETVSAALVGYRFVIAINGPQDASASDLFAFDVCMSDYQDPQVMNP